MPILCLFLAPGVKWDNSVNRGFIVNEPTGLKRSPTTLASDLEGFLSCLGTYLPIDYVSEKIIAESRDM